MMTKRKSKSSIFFAGCFNSFLPPLSSEENVCSSEEDNLCPDDFLCDEEEVLELLLSIDTTKANDPDGISGLMLKVTANAIFPSVTVLFNKWNNTKQMQTSQ